MYFGRFLVNIVCFLFPSEDVWTMSSCSVNFSYHLLSTENQPGSVPISSTQIILRLKNN